MSPIHKQLKNNYLSKRGINIQSIIIIPFRNVLGIADTRTVEKTRLSLRIIMIFKG
jgi:hypothetical protein